jgi:hypothetical protein
MSALVHASVAVTSHSHPVHRASVRDRVAEKGDGSEPLASTAATPKKRESSPIATGQVIQSAALTMHHAVGFYRVCPSCARDVRAA